MACFFQRLIADIRLALAAEQADLSLGEEPAAEEEGEADAEALQAAASDRFVGKSKQELLELFARMLEEQPVQTLRRDVEALKVAFYKLRRAEVEDHSAVEMEDLSGLF